MAKLGRIKSPDFGLNYFIHILALIEIEIRNDKQVIVKIKLAKHWLCKTFYIFLPSHIFNLSLKTMKIFFSFILFSSFIFFASFKPVDSIDDTRIITKVIKDDWKIDLQISFNAKEGKEGKVRIINSLKQVVAEFDIELKSSPDYYNINLNEYGNDNYLLELITPIGKHQTHFVIK